MGITESFQRFISVFLQNSKLFGEQHLLLQQGEKAVIGKHTISGVEPHGRFPCSPHVLIEFDTNDAKLHVVGFTVDEHSSGDIAIRLDRTYGFNKLHELVKTVSDDVYKNLNPMKMTRDGVIRESNLKKLGVNIAPAGSSEE